MQPTLIQPFYYRIYFSIAFLIAFAGLFVPLMDNDAGHHANIALHMYLTGDYVSLIDHNGDYLDKPHLHFWLAAAAYHIFGVTGFAYKFPSFLFSIWGVYSTYRLGTILYNKETGRLAALVLSTCFAFFLAMTDVRMDAILTACIIFTAWQGISWVNTRSILPVLGMALGAALGFSTKGHIALFVPAISIFLYIVYTKKWSSFYHWHLLLFAVTFFALISPVLYSYYLQFDLHPEKVIRGEAGRSGIAFIMWNQNIERISGEKFGSDAAGDRLFFFHTFLWAFAPWSILAYAAIFNRVKNIRKQHSEWITAGTILLFAILITFAGFKLPHYLNVILPMASIMTAGYLVQQNNTTAIKHLLTLQYIVCTLALVLILVLNGWAFPPANIGVIIGFIVLAVISWFIYHKQSTALSKLVAMTAMSFFLIFYTLNLNFYPSLLTYQGGNELAFTTKEKVDSKQVYYWPGVYSSSYDFYSSELRKEYHDSITTTPLWIMIDKNNLGELEQKGLKIIDQVSHRDYEITRLDLRFINPARREAELNELMLVRVK